MNVQMILAKPHVAVLTVKLAAMIKMLVPRTIVTLQLDV
jgi:hypothetical protein